MHLKLKSREISFPNYLFPRWPVLSKFWTEHDSDTVELFAKFQFDLTTDVDVIAGRGLQRLESTWWRHQMETFSALLAICAGNSPVPGEFPTQRPVTRSFDVFFDLCLNKRLSKQSWGWWFDKISRSLWRHRNEDELRAGAVNLWEDPPQIAFTVML